MMQIEAHSWDEAPASLLTDWSQLVADKGLNASLDPGWMDAAVRSHGCAPFATIVAARRNGRLVGVLPLICRRQSVHGVPLRTVDLAANLVSYHPEIIASEPCAELLLESLKLAHGGSWDLLRANQVPAGSATIEALREYAKVINGVAFEEAGESSPYLAISTSWDVFLNARDAKFRANRSRAARRAHDHGSASMTWFDGGVDPVGLLQDILEIERRSWKAATGIAITSRQVERDYHERLLQFLSQHNAILGNVLHIDARPVAYVLACRWHGWVGQLKTSYDESLKHVGAYVIDESVRRAFESGAREYDFLGDATPHKLRWSSTVREHRTLWLYSRRLSARIVALSKRIASRLRSH
jgi:CelD/BcsL family acetyltransferase involved in cellulose biosynthesis